MTGSRRRRWVTMVTLLCALFGRPDTATADAVTTVSPSIATIPGGPGSVAGMAVDPAVALTSGQVTYEVPVELPRARHGFGPTLALRYHGAAGTGPLGVGWALGSPKLARSTRHGVPTFTDGDDIELRDGPGLAGRLVALSADAYRLEGHGNRVRVLREDDGFCLEDGSGQAWHFAPEDAAAGFHGSAQWLLVALTDSHGQRVTYRYEQDGNTQYLAHITWGPEEAFAVALRYAARPDPVITYREGRRQLLARRLTGIVVTASGREVRALTLTYDDTHGLGRLSRVLATGLDGRGAMPPVDLTYAAPAAPAEIVLESTRNWRPGEQQTALVDVDGDGIQDLLSLQDGAYLRNQGGRFDAPSRLPGGPAASLADTRLVDIDHDGSLELLRDRPGGWGIWRLQGAGWHYAGIWPGTTYGSLRDPRVVLADLNGDGLVDRIIDGGGYLDVAMGTAGGFAPERRQPGVPYAAAQPGSPTARVLDVNGDGLADIVGLSDHAFVTLLGRGDGTFEELGWFHYPWEGSTAAPSALAVADLDRDGIADLIYLGQRHVVWYPGAAQGGVGREAQTLAAPRGAVGPIYLGDVNGNGSIDLVWASGHAVDLGGATAAGMLATVSNGLGQTTAFAYESASRLAAAARARGQPWEHVVPVAMPVCTSQTTTIAGRALPETITFEVRDATWDYRDNAFAGFLGAWRVVQGDSEAATLLVWQRYHAGVSPLRALRGHVLQTTRWSGSSGQRLLDDTTQIWDVAHPCGASPDAAVAMAVPILVEERRAVYEGEPVAVERSTRHGYDAEGNRLLTEDSGRIDQQGDEQVVRRTFGASDRPWRRGVLTSESVETPAGEVLSQTRHTFGDAMVGRVENDVGDGLLRRTDGWLAEEGRWVCQVAIDRDALGNVVHRFEAGRHTWLDYDAAGLYPVSETLRPAPDRALVWEMTWQPWSGRLTKIVGPDGSAVSMEYDALGRPERLARGAADPLETYAYDWTAPLPSTTSTVHDGAAGTRVTRTTYDGAGALRVSATQVAADTWRTGGIHTYDRRGLLARRSVPVLARSAADLEGGGPLTGTERTYDALGRLVRERLPSGAEWSTSFAPFTEIHREPEQAPIRHVFDGQGHVVATSREVNGHVETTTATYDAAGRTRAYVQEGGAAAHTFTYDSLGRLVASSSPETGVREVGYDDHGWPTWQRNAAGQTITSRYDDVGRVLEVTAEGGRYRFGYDVPGSPDATYTAGRLALVEQPTGRVAFSYDAAGRAVREEHEIHGETSWQSDTLSPAGTLLRRCFDDGICQDNAYDAYGLLRRIHGVWEALGYDARGELTGEALANGVRQHWERDILGQVVRTTLTTPKGTALDLAAIYTSFGALTGIVDYDRTGEDHTARYTYDAAARVTAAEVGPHTFGYAYDALANLTDRSYRGPDAQDAAFGARAFDSARPRQLARAGALMLAYDEAGRAKQVGDRRLAHDAFDRLREVAGPGGEITAHAYGWQGSRVWSATADGTAIRTFTPYLEQRDARRHHRLTIGGRTVARLDSNPDGHGRAVTFLHAALGEGAALLTDETGTVIDERLFEPFGQPLTGRLDREHTGAAGRPVDAGTGWVDHDARWMAPNLAAFLAPDPPLAMPSAERMRRPWDLNAYAFARHSPLLFVDPDGQTPVLRNPERAEPIPPGAYPPIVFGVDTRPIYDPPIQRVMGPHEYALAAVSGYSLLRTGALALQQAGIVDKAIAIMASPLARFSPVMAARAHQLGAPVNRLDEWSKTIITEGTTLVGASPGQGEFFSEFHALECSAGSLNNYYHMLQIPDDVKFDFRKGVTLYRALQDTPAAVSTAAANGNLGAGGMRQFYIPNWQESFEAFLSIPMEGSRK